MLLLTLDGVGVEYSKSMDLIKDPKPLDCAFPETLMQGHTVSSSGAMTTGRTPHYNGKVANRFGWDINRGINSHKQLDEDEYMWEILDRNEIQSLIMNHPIAYPPPKTFGVFIGGILSGSRYANPPYMEERLENGYYVDEKKFEYPMRKNDMESHYIIDLDKSDLSFEEIYDFCYKMIENRTETAIGIYEEIDPEFTWIWYAAPDRIFHNLSVVADDMEEEARKLLDHLNKNMKKLIDVVDEGEDIIYHSDHGLNLEGSNHERYGFVYIPGYDFSAGHIVDIMPTAFDMLDLDIPDYWEGGSLISDKKGDTEYQVNWREKYVDKSEWSSILDKLDDPPGDILEVGCGPGMFADFLDSKGYDVLASDVSKPAVKRAKENHEDVIQLNIEDVSELDREFDFIVGQHIIEHVDDVKALNGCLEVLKPCGKIVMVVPSEEHLKHRNYPDPDHERYYSEQEFERLNEEFNNIEWEKEGDLDYILTLDK